MLQGAVGFLLLSLELPKDTVVIPLSPYLTSKSKNSVDEMMGGINWWTKTR